MKEDKPYNQFDSLIKDKISSDSVQPAEILWKRLNDQLATRDQNVKRRKFYYWSVSSVLFIFMITIGLIIFNSQSSKKEKELSAKNCLTFIKKENSVSISHSHMNASRESTTYQNSGSVAKDVIPVEESIKKMNKENSTEKNNLYIQKESAVDFSHSMQSNRSEFQTVVAEEKKTSEINSIMADSSDVQVIQLAKTNNLLGTIEKANDMSVISPQNDESENVVQNKLENQDSIQLDSTDERFVSKVEPKATQDTSKSEITYNAKDIENVTKKWYVSANLNSVHSYRNLRNKQSTGTIMNSEYYNEREKGNFQLNYGITAGYTLNNLIAIRSGINFSNYSVTFTEQNRSMDFDTIDNELQIETTYGEFEINENEFEGENEDNSNETGINEGDTNSIVLSFTNVQKIKFIQIPLELEFGFQRNQWRYSLRTGLSYSYLISEKSEFETNGFSPVRKNNSSLLNRNSLTTTFAIGVEYFIKNNLSVLLSPNFTYSLSSLSRNSEFKTIPYWIGLETSVKYYLK